MRTDYKIAIAALVLLGLGVVVWSFMDPTPVEDTPQDKTPPPIVKNEPVDEPSTFYRTRREDDVATSTDEGPITGRDRTLPPTDDVAGRDTVTPTADTSGGTPLSGLAAYLEAVRRRAAETARAEEAARSDTTGPTPGSNIASMWRDSGAGDTTTGDTTTYPLDTGATRTPDPVGPAAFSYPEKTYTVKDGDNGFWTVSKNAYGDGKYWALIAKANPQADSDRLAVGQVLKVPALAVETARATGADTTTTSAGQVRTEADGKRYYTVKDGDAGFWTVAAKAYGNGKHWALIAQANPNMVSARLRKGQKLLVPALPASESSPTRTPAALGRTLNPGEKWYTVVDGDAGFWDVSKKSYGHGKHYAIIAKANPNVNSGRLRKGQKILVPPLPASATRVRTATAPRRRPTVAASTAGYGDVPIFD